MPTKDKQKQAKYAKKHYEVNKEKMIQKAKDNNKRSRDRNRQYVLEYLENHPCVDCGEKDPIVLEFDHVRDKLFDVSDIKRSAYSLKTIEEEIKKCEVRCANCHRRITHKRRVDLVIQEVS